MNRNIVGILGFILILAGAAMPFLPLQQGHSDMLPALVGFAVFIVGVMVLFRAIGPRETPAPRGFPVESRQD